MSIGQILVCLVLAFLCGLLAQAIAGRSLGGFIVSTLIGLIGAVVGRLIAQALKAPEPLVIGVGGESIPVLWSIIGATLTTLLVVYMRGGKRGSRQG